MKTIQYLSLGLLSLALAACSGSSDSKKSTNKPVEQPSVDLIATAYQGIWQASGYGVVYEIKSDSVNRYSYTKDYCLMDFNESELTSEDILELFSFSNDGNTMENYAEFGTLDFHAPAVSFAKQVSLPSACIDNLIAHKVQAGYQADTSVDFEFFHQLFAQYYVDFSLKSVDWNALHQTYISSINATSSEMELLDVMYAMLAPLSDTHVTVSNEEVNFTHINKPIFEHMLAKEYADSVGLPFPIPAEQATPEVLASLYAYIAEQKSLQTSIIDDYAENEEDINTSANGIVRWFENQGLGYISINQMHGLTATDSTPEVELNAIESVIDTVLADLVNVDGLIIDVRENQGGTDLYSLAIASRFVASDLPVFSKQTRLADSFTPPINVIISPRGDEQYLGNIVLLTSSTTTSAAEKFVLAMRALPNVTVVGESTQGALSYRLEKMLPNGINVSLSNEKYLSHDGQWYEAVGIPVDVEVPYATLEQRLEEVDLGIETAIAILTE